MEKKVLKGHVKGQKHIGKTDWSKVRELSTAPKIDNENPEIAFKKPCSKPVKS